MRRNLRVLALPCFLGRGSKRSRIGKAYRNVRFKISRIVGGDDERISCDCFTNEAV